MAGTYFTYAELGEMLSLVEQEASRLGSKLERELNREVWHYRQTKAELAAAWGERIERLRTVSLKLQGVRVEALEWERRHG